MRPVVNRRLQQDELPLWSPRRWMWRLYRFAQWLDWFGACSSGRLSVGQWRARSKLLELWPRGAGCISVVIKRNIHQLQQRSIAIVPRFLHQVIMGADLQQVAL